MMVQCWKTGRVFDADLEFQKQILPAWAPLKQLFPLPVDHIKANDSYVLRSVINNNPVNL